MLADPPDGKPDIILIATGSELSLAADAHERLRLDGIRSRVVSMPSWDVFERETREYRDAVLPPEVTARVAIEQASTFGWERYVGRTGRVIGMHTFGASAPLKALQQEFGFTVDHVVATVKALLRPCEGRIAMADIEQPRTPRSAEHARLAELVARYARQLESDRALRQRAGLGHGTRRLQRRRTSVAILPLRTRALARLSVERGWSRRPQRP